ncbi:ABC transporter ATP-binding protein [Lachnospiraceae bacterium 54-53]
MSDALLTVDDLRTYFYTASGVSRAVDGVSFRINRGEIMGIVGESGSGKSVASSSIIRLLPARTGKIVSGSINFEGTDVLKLGKKDLLAFRGRDVSMIFQNPMTSLSPVFKVGHQMVEMICANHKMSRQEACRMGEEALKKVGIPDARRRMDSYPYELSGGMCQRVIIAMALCCNPRLIIADEPTTALDVTVQAQVLELLKDMRDKNGTAILLITHNLGVVWQMCDSVMVMYAGKTVEYTSCRELHHNPLHPYTWGLLDSMPKLSSDSGGELATIQGTPPDLRLTGTCCNFSNRCPYAKELCRTQVPDLKELEPGHFVACHRQQEAVRLLRGGVKRDE